MIEQFRSGTTYEKRFPIGDYDPADGWGGTLYLRSERGGGYSIYATVDGDEFVVTANAYTTDLWAPGLYNWFFLVGKSNNKYIIEEGRIQILPSVGDLTTTDSRTHVKKTLDALEALLEGKATKDVQEYTIGGRSLSKMTPAELLKWRNKYKEFYRQECVQEKVRQGLPAGNKVFTRF